MLDRAELRGNKAEREILGSLKNMKKLGIVHETLSFESIDDSEHKTMNMIKSSYSMA